MSRETKGIFLTILGGICWGFSGVCGKYLFDTRDLTATWLVTMRLSVAGVLLLLLAFRSQKGKLFDVWKVKRDAKEMLLFGFLGMTFCQLTYFLAIEASNAGTATVLQYTAPVIIMLFYLFVEKKKPNVLEVIVLAMVVIGTYILATHGSFTNLAITKRALIWGLLAAVTLCVYNIQPRRLLAEYGSIPTVGWGMFLGGICFCLIFKPWHVVGTWDMGTFVGLALVIVVGTMVSFCCYLEGVNLIGPVKASMFACVEPLVATLLSVVVMKEPFSNIDFVGILLIIVAVSLLAVKDSKE